MFNATYEDDSLELEKIGKNMEIGKSEHLGKIFERKKKKDMNRERP